MLKPMNNEQDHDVMDDVEYLLDEDYGYGLEDASLFAEYAVDTVDEDLAIVNNLLSRGSVSRR